ncbi:MAG: DinB family protein [Pseudomonadota bacterium]
MSDLLDTPFLAQALNNAWANATLYRAVTQLSAQAASAPAPGFFPSLIETLNHIYEVDLYYVDALEGAGVGRAVFDREVEWDPRLLAKAQAEVDLRLAQFCKALSPDRLSQTCQTERAHGMVAERVDALLLHLFQHQIHHRGQAHVQLQAAGHPPPQLDDFYLNFGRVPSAQAYFES